MPTGPSSGMRLPDPAGAATQQSTRGRKRQSSGSKETLAAFYKEFETTLSYVSPALYTLAVEGFIHEQGRTVIFALGQAAQLDGDMPRRPATWDNPASTDPNDYVVSDEAISAAPARIHVKNYLKNPTIGPDPPALPPGTLYPINETYYRLSTSLLRNFNMQLRNTVLKFIADNAMRTILAQKFPDDGRALLAHLREQSKIPLTTSQVNSILADIDALTDAGLKFDDVASFRQYGVIYQRILSRIPDANPNKDTRAVQAMRFIKVTMNKREDVGRALYNHFGSHSVDTNDPDAVQLSICNFLEDQATVTPVKAVAEVVEEAIESASAFGEEDAALAAELSESLAEAANAKDPLRQAEAMAEAPATGRSVAGWRGVSRRPSSEPMFELA